jgi:hypothetical protein
MHTIHKLCKNFFKSSIHLLIGLWIMPKSQSLQRVLALAKEKEKKYDWLKVAELYEQAIGAVGKKDFLEKGKIQERIGYAFYRVAMQAESVDEFRERMRQAAANYEKAMEFYGRLSGQSRLPWMLRCDAVIAYVGYWLNSDVSEKKRLLDECWRLVKEALKTFEEAGECLDYGKTYNQLSSSASDKYFLEEEFEAREKVNREALEHGEQAINLLSGVDDASELAKAYVKTGICLSGFGCYHVPDMDEKERYYQRSRGYWQKAIELSEETAFLEILNVSGCTFEDWSIEDELVQYETALGRARKTKDKYLIGNALDWLATASYWKSVEIEDPDKRIEIHQKALQYAEDAKDNFSSISFISARVGSLWTGAPHTEYYWKRALWETDLKNKRDLLEKAVINEASFMELAESTRCPDIIAYAHHALSKALGSLAQIETNLEEKRRFLTKALEHRNESVRITEQIERFRYWNLGVDWNYLADLKAELSNCENDPEKRQKTLEEAVSDKERCLQLCLKEMPHWEKTGARAIIAHLGLWQHSYGELLNRLYGLTSNSEHKRRTIKAFEDAAESFGKVDMNSRVAECHWKIAKVHDILGEHLEAAENFKRASESYMRAAEKIPQLKDFYEDHASYMQAWNEIEKAKHHHAEQRYGLAKEHYAKAANLHESTERWNYLGPNYVAWEQLEEAEDLSRREENQKAKNLFQQVAGLFVEVKKSIEAKLERIEVKEEKTMATELVKASDVRRGYCLGRIAIEEAKILDRMGDHIKSSKKYGSAAETFQKIAKAQAEQSRKELQPIIYLCQAWQKMMMAEAKASSMMYGEAAELFKQTKEHTIDQQTSLLALANSSFCKALEAGTEFEITRDLKTYSTTKKYMEAAANYYRKAGFKNASEYAKATLLLFDAYMYITKAETETDPARKAQFCQMAEKLLPTSAGSYIKAKHPEKSEEVKKLLEGVKEKRQLAMSLTELIHAPTVTSTTTSFSTPTATHEKAVGLERFERADIQANLTASEEVTIEEEVEVRLDLVNVAKESGLLVRVDNLVPPGFKLIALPSQGSMENGSIDLKGKKLGPLKVETVKLSLQATETGVANLSPQVIYVDALGKFRTRRLEPVAITVHPKLAFEFKTEVAQRVFSFLVSSFVEDYMRRRLSLEKAGWRTLMEIVKHGKVSKSSVYGAGGHRGPAVSELERRGLVETRIFPGERGRGGRISKMRISYEKETIKRHIDQQVMKIKEK